MCNEIVPSKYQHFTIMIGNKMRLLILPLQYDDHVADNIFEILVYYNNI